MDTKKLRQKILDLAIRGKLVPQDSNDEPASVLLDRIRAEKERLMAEGKIKRSKKSKTSDASHYQNFEPPFEIPDNWEWVKISNILTKITDGTHHSPTSFPVGKYKYVTAKNIKSEGIDLTNISFVDEAVHNEIYARCNPEYGDILYIKDGATTGVVTLNTL
jgi:type I restriction enzyme S subunit